ncbi:hypothetical protein EBB06_10755 [Crenobacter cavernae]|uniref:Uncharacterized protein n=1 Tax=Crenobacter cavernae TaxID=2290923 RepID=A0ABY0FF46_9NEIS|nr:hypothetical protein EBB06_10755 [Crenobacter cavernae]
MRLVRKRVGQAPEPGASAEEDVSPGGEGAGANLGKDGGDDDFLHENSASVAMACSQPADVDLAPCRQ